MIRIDVESGDVLDIDSDVQTTQNHIVVPPKSTYLNDFTSVETYGEVVREHVREYFIHRVVKVFTISARDVCYSYHPIDDTWPEIPFNVDKTTDGDVFLSRDVLEKINAEIYQLETKMSSFGKRLHEFRKLIANYHNRDYKVVHHENMSSNGNGWHNMSWLHVQCNDLANLSTVLKDVSSSLTHMSIDFFGLNYRVMLADELRAIVSKKSLRHLSIRTCGNFRQDEFKLLPLLLGGRLDSLSIEGIPDSNWLDDFFVAFGNNKSLKKLKIVYRLIEPTAKMLEALQKNRHLQSLAIDTEFWSDRRDQTDVFVKVIGSLNGVEQVSFPSKNIMVARDQRLLDALKRNISITQLEVKGHELFAPIFARNLLLKPAVVMQKLMNIILALASLDVPPYVLLEIFDWIDQHHLFNHRAKIDAIYRIRNSIQKVVQSRESSNKMIKLFED